MVDLLDQCQKANDAYSVTMAEIKKTGLGFAGVSEELREKLRADYDLIVEVNKKRIKREGILPPR